MMTTNTQQFNGLSIVFPPPENVTGARSVAGHCVRCDRDIIGERVLQATHEDGITVQYHVECAARVLAEYGIFARMERTKRANADDLDRARMYREDAD